MDLDEAMHEENKNHVQEITSMLSQDVNSFIEISQNGVEFGYHCNPSKTEFLSYDSEDFVEKFDRIIGGYGHSFRS